MVQPSKNLFHKTGVFTCFYVFSSYKFCMLVRPLCLILMFEAIKYYISCNILSLYVKNLTFFNRAGILLLFYG